MGSIDPDGPANSPASAFSECQSYPGSPRISENKNRNSFDSAEQDASPLDNSSLDAGMDVLSPNLTADRSVNGDY